MRDTRSFKPYQGKDIKAEEAVLIRGVWLYAEKNEGETQELLGNYSVFAIGWGSEFLDWDSFTAEEQEALLTTIK